MNTNVPITILEQIEQKKNNVNVKDEMTILFQKLGIR